MYERGMTVRISDNVGVIEGVIDEIFENVGVFTVKTASTRFVSIDYTAPEITVTRIRGVEPTALGTVVIRQKTRFVKYSNTETARWISENGVTYTWENLPLT